MATIMPIEAHGSTSIGLVITCVCGAAVGLVALLDLIVNFYAPHVKGKQNFNHNTHYRNLIHI